MLNSDLTSLSATDVVAEIAAQRLTSLALVEACLARIKERDEVGAWAWIDPDLAKAQAAEADAAVANGLSLGPLHGVPVGIKDVIDTFDMPTERGTVVFDGRQPAADATVVSALRAAGAVIIGKTVTTELAFFGPGKTRNPHDLERTPGGSSSGSAAAVADFHVPLAIGTQTAGSLIRPASYCGVIGFKPTFGWLPRTGVLAQSEPLDTIGGYARSIEDMALLIDAMRSDDPADPDLVLGKNRPSLAAELMVLQPSAPRIAFYRTPVWQQAEPGMKAAMEVFAETLALTAHVENITMPPAFDRTPRLQQIVQFSDIAKNYGPIANANPGKMSSKLDDVIAQGQAFTRDDYTSAIDERDEMYRILQDVFTRYDVIMAPAAAGPALRGLGSTGLPAFQGYWTYLGVPVISLPLLSIDGLPGGVQLIAPRDSDGALLRTAQWMMRETASLGAAAK